MQYTVITHDGDFHADDVFGVATLQLHLGVENVRVVRTRENNQIAAGDWVLDVGGVYDGATHRFDHHQNDAPVRDNGIPYAAFGLLWKQFGEELAGSPEAAAWVEQHIVLPIDAADNGMPIYTTNATGISPFEMHDVVMLYRPSWGSAESLNERFLDAVAVARDILTRSIDHARASVRLGQYVQETYEHAADKRTIIFDVRTPPAALIGYSGVQFSVCPTSREPSSNWEVAAVRTHNDTFDTFVRFPKAWAGLRDAELIAASGIPDAVFCHRSQTFFVARSKAGVLSAIAQAS